MIWSRSLVKLDGSKTTYISSELWIISFCTFPAFVVWMTPQCLPTTWCQLLATEKNPPKKPMANCKSKPVWPNEWVKILAGWRSWRNGEPLLDIGGVWPHQLWHYMLFDPCVSANSFAHLVNQTQLFSIGYSRKHCTRELLVIRYSVAISSCDKK